MTTSDVKVTPGTGANVATYSITEDSETKQLQRVVLNNSDGTLGLSSPGQSAMAAASPVVIASDQTSVPVGIDTSLMCIGAANQTVTPKFATVVVSASGATTIVAAVTSKKLRVLALKLTANGAVNVKWQSHVTPTDITGLSYYAAAGDGEVLSFNPVGWFQTIAGEALDINLSGAVAVGGHITYIEV